MSSTGFRRIGLATLDLPRGGALHIPRSGYSAGGGGEFGAEITDPLRVFAVTREPVAHRVVFTVAHDIFDNWFELKLEGDEKGDQSKQLDKTVQTDLLRLKAKRELTRMAVFERAFGWSIIVLGYKDSAQSLAEPLSNPTELVEIKAYSPTQIPSVDVVKDQDDIRYGLPELYKIKRPGIATHLKIHHTRVIHFSTRWVDTNKEEWKGQSTLNPIWDDLVTLRNIRWGMGQTMYRYGSGFPDITFTGAEKADIDSYIDSGAFANLSARTFFVHSEDQELEFKGLQGRALDPMNYYLPPMEHISCGTGIPLAILRGVQAGALTGSEVNQMEYYGLVSDEQSAYESGIRKLIDIILGEKKVEYEFEWQGGFELGEEKKAAIDLQEAQRLQILGQFKTRNEIRKELDPDLPELSEEQGGNEVLGKSPSFDLNEGGAFHVEPHSDGTATVRELRKRPTLRAYR